jgi:hypothetical protein
VSNETNRRLLEYFRPQDEALQRRVDAHDANATQWDIARARAQASANEILRGRVHAFLSLPGPLATRGKLPRGRYCGDCRASARYPDNRCAMHTAYLGGTEPDRRAEDASESAYLSLWRRFFGQVGTLLGAPR